MTIEPPANLPDDDEYTKQAEKFAKSIDKILRKSIASVMTRLEDFEAPSTKTYTKEGANCGTGAGGFQAGNDCAGGEGGGATSAERAEKRGDWKAPYDVSEVSQEDAENIIRNSPKSTYPQHDDIGPTTGFLLSDGTPIQYGLPGGEKRDEIHDVIAPDQATLLDMGATISEERQQIATTEKTAQMYAVMESANAVRVHISDEAVMIDKVGELTRSQKRRLHRTIRDLQPDLVVMEFLNTETGVPHHGRFHSGQLQEIRDGINSPFDDKEGGLEKTNNKAADCGTGAGGFKPGNDCAGGEGGGAKDNMLESDISTLSTEGDIADYTDDFLYSEGGFLRSGAIWDIDGKLTGPRDFDVGAVAQESINNYTTGGYTGYAQYSRDGEMPPGVGEQGAEAFKKRYAALEEITDGNILENGKPTAVYRGCGKTETKAILKRLETSDSLEFKPFLSTSTDADVAEAFVRPAYIDRVRTTVMMKLRTAKGAFIGSHSLHKEESEVLLPPRSKWRLVEKRKEFVPGRFTGEGSTTWLLTLEEIK